MSSLLVSVWVGSALIIALLSALAIMGVFPSKNYMPVDGKVSQPLGP